MSAPTLTPHRITTLPGGLPLLLADRGGPALLAARLVMPGGSSLDPRGGRGAHQLLAGTMTRGCGDLDADALADLVEGAGAGLRCEAHEDALVLALHCAAEDAGTLLPLLLAMVRRPQLDPHQIEIERDLNLQTLQRQREDPFQLAHDGLRHLLHGTGPYGHDPLGVEADLAELGPAELKPLVADLGSRGAVLVLCGEPTAGVESLLSDQLAATPWTTASPEAAVAGWADTTPSEAAGERLALLEQDTEQLVLMLGCATVPLGHPDSLALRLLQNHLGQGMSSRLFQVMREERGLAYDVGVHLPARRGPSPFVMHLSTSADRAGEATACLLAEWRRLLEQPLSDAELALALAKLRGQDAMGRQTCSQIAERLALLLSHGLPADQAERRLEQAAGLTPADLQAAALRQLQAPRLSLVGPADALREAERAWTGAQWASRS
jgi:predicted Zn-dependent peptidase